MKLWHKILIILCCVVLVGSIIFVVVRNKNQKFELIINTPSFETTVNQTIDLIKQCGVVVKPSSSNIKPTFESENSELASVEFLTGILQTKAVGNVNIVVKVNNGTETITKQISVSIKNSLEPIREYKDEQTLSVSSGNTFIYYTKTTTSVELLNFEPTMSESGILQIISYDYGYIVVKPLKTGSVNLILSADNYELIIPIKIV